ncbi:hypothetical protein BSIN_3877 [Burkholderia singularis]|uniref:Uncharacterized protein n=1 Tax=Burkholderia singularis TaxID=1503053 RepID=A0A238H6D6_9BURK|nr:hypothetical protein BSIN_3877 [Burkholderia singularis]
MVVSEDRRPATDSQFITRKKEKRSPNVQTALFISNRVQ